MSDEIRQSSPLIDQLRQMRDNEEFPLFSIHQLLLLEEEDRNCLDEFLSATMDEARLYYAETFCESVLRLFAIDDSIYFRRAVLLRELSRNVGYNRQRDHAAHTLHNFLLGWYLFERSTPIRSELEAQFKLNLGENQDGPTHFRNIWPIPTLLHDIGYLFEGSVASQEFLKASDTAIEGAKYVNDYFAHHFWEACGLTTSEQRAAASRLAASPRIVGETLVSIANSLRTIPSMVEISRKLQEHVSPDHPLGSVGHKFTPLKHDGFELWEQYYESFGNSNMAARVRALRKADQKFLTDGLMTDSDAIRVMDHGIYGAFIQLQISALWYEIACADSAEDVAAAAAQEILITSSTAENDPGWFWSGVVWATAAIAFHNVAQLGRKWPGATNDDDLRISLREDALTFLSVLVDVLEEWDRYSVTRNSIFMGVEHLPVQSKDVRVEWMPSGIVRFTYPNEKIANKVRKGLNKSLQNWDDVVCIYPQESV